METIARTLDEVYIGDAYICAYKLPDGTVDVGFFKRRSKGYKVCCEESKEVQKKDYEYNCWLRLSSTQDQHSNDDDDTLIDCSWTYERTGFLCGKSNQFADIGEKYYYVENGESYERTVSCKILFAVSYCSARWDLKELGVIYSYESLFETWPYVDQVKRILANIKHLPEFKAVFESQKDLSLEEQELLVLYKLLFNKDYQPSKGKEEHEKLYSAVQICQEMEVPLFEEYGFYWYPNGEYSDLLEETLTKLDLKQEQIKNFSSNSNAKKEHFWTENQLEILSLLGSLIQSKEDPNYINALLNLLYMYANVKRETLLKKRA